MTAANLALWQSFGLAYLLDRALGDPPWLPHPVRLMGRMIETLEPVFRRLPMPLVAAGGLFAFFQAGLVFFLAWGLLVLARHVHPWLGSVLETVFLYYCIAARCLDQAAGEVEIALNREDLEKARRALSMIVGRETKDLTRVQVCRAAIETVAENFVDAVLSPFFWMAVGGAPAAMTFKMVSTLDSMVGYRNHRYLWFGKVSARLDDLANYLPARLCPPVIAIAARLCALSPAESLMTARREGNRHKSPNAGYPEAAFAGALKVKLNGPAKYHGQWVEKPFIGERFGDPDASHIAKARRLMRVSAWIGAALTLMVLYWIQRQ